MPVVLAIDLGEYKSVACRYEEGEFAFRTSVARREALDRLLAEWRRGDGVQADLDRLSDAQAKLVRIHPDKTLLGNTLSSYLKIGGGNFRR